MSTVTKLDILKIAQTILPEKKKRQITRKIRRKKTVCLTYFYLISSNKYSILQSRHVPCVSRWIVAHADRHQLHRRHKHRPTGMENNLHIIKCKTRNNIPKTKHTYIINEYVTSSDHMNNYLFCDVIVLPLLLSLVFTITALHFYTILLYFFVLMSVLIHTVCLSFTLTLCLSFTLRLLIPDDFDNLFIIFLFYWMNEWINCSVWYTENVWQACIAYI